MIDQTKDRKISIEEDKTGVSFSVCPKCFGLGGPNTNTSCDLCGGTGRVNIKANVMTRGSGV